jgi:hypothetical protein
MGSRHMSLTRRTRTTDVASCSSQAPHACGRRLKALRSFISPFVCSLSFHSLKANLTYTNSRATNIFGPSAPTPHYSARHCACMSGNEHHDVRGKIEYRETATNLSYGLTYRSSRAGTAYWSTGGSAWAWQQPWGSESTALQLRGSPSVRGFTHKAAAPP